ncbi:MAG: hypothetical protein RIS85_2632 [Pseudomonadota bacterium]
MRKNGGRGGRLHEQPRSSKGEEREKDHEMGAQQLLFLGTGRAKAEINKRARHVPMGGRGDAAAEKNLLFGRRRNHHPATLFPACYG